MRKTKRFFGVPAALALCLGIFFAQESLSQDVFLGGVPSEEKTADTLRLSLADAIRKGLLYNLGALVSDQSVQAARGARLAALSRLRPQVTAGAGIDYFALREKEQDPTNAIRAGVAVTQPVLDFPSLRRKRAAEENLKAAEFSNENARDMTAYVVSMLYLQTVADKSRIEAARAQVRTARSLYDLAVDQKAAGVVSGIEVLRAQVELQSEQQRLIVAEDQFAKNKLTLARAIGLPLGQEFELADNMPFVPIPVLSLEESIERALRERPDYHSAEAGLRAAELERKAAEAGNLPSLSVGADYQLRNQAQWEGHGSQVAIGASLNVPVFTGGAVRSRVIEADAALNRLKAEFEDLKASIHYDIRKAFLDLKAAEERVKVAESAVLLAGEQVTQSESRFRAGVTNNVEVVQAQEALATANENHISGLHAHNMAKLALARALGVSDREYEQFLKGK
ncbi:MAG: TolC family protein [Acidobacteriota bacterium]|nr:TolC family protein [Acidobacteriota bacterium]